MKNIFIILFIQLTLINLSKCDCGEPGRSIIASTRSNELRADKIYPEGHTVTYDCDTVLIGITKEFVGIRKCVAGRWTGSIPKCPSRFNHLNLSIKANGKSIDVRWIEPKIVVAMRLGFKLLIHNHVPNMN